MQIWYIGLICTINVLYHHTFVMFNYFFQFFFQIDINDTIPTVGIISLVIY